MFLPFASRVAPVKLAVQTLLDTFAKRYARLADRRFLLALAIGSAGSATRATALHSTCTSSKRQDQMQSEQPFDLGLELRHLLLQACVCCQQRGLLCLQCL